MNDRITKYNPINRVDEVYIADEWTSFYQLKYFLICKTQEANKTAQLPYEKPGKPYFSFWEKKKGRIFLSLHLITGADYGARSQRSTRFGHRRL